MLTIETLLETFPPASLAEADLPSFLTRVLNRLQPNELEPLERVLETERPPGYPAALGPVLLAVVHYMRAENILPDELDPDAMDEILAQQSVVNEVEGQISVERSILRPGLPVTAEVRDQLGGNVRQLFGVGPQLVLISPVVVLRLPGLGWSTVRSPALGKLMEAEEAEVLQDSWADVEEFSAWPHKESLLWEARFVRITSRPNHDAWHCARVLRLMLPNRRSALWMLLIDHLMDQELPEPYRPGPHGLERALVAARLDLEKDAVKSMLGIARNAYETCGPNPAAEIGDFTCSKADLHAFSTWVNVPESIRDRLTSMAPELVEHYLRRLAAEESPALQTRMEAQLARTLRTFRDGYLRPRYRRDVRALMGVDPLTLADQWVESGKHQNRIIEDLKALAKRVQAHHAAAQAAELAAQEKASASRDDAPSEEENGHEGDAAANLENSENVESENVLAEEEISLPEPTGDDGEDGLVNPVEEVGTVSSTNEQKLATDGDVDVAEEQGGDSAGPAPESELPPMPVPPPPRRRTMTTRPIVLPPMPKVPGNGVASEHADDEPSMPTPSMPEPAHADPLETPNPIPSPSGNPTSTNRLVTPDQGAEFYENAFRELEVLERDLLERGPWDDARERVKALNADADVLTEALGPAARSGDERFGAALRKVELVRSYLVRIQSICDGTIRIDEPKDASPSSTKKRGRITRILNRDNDDD